MEKHGLGGSLLMYIICSLVGGCAGPHIFHFNKFLAAGAGLLLGELVGIFFVAVMLLVVYFLQLQKNFSN